MTATFYFHVADGDLRAENAGDNVRIVVGNFGWTILLEDRLDCARWMKALADADALFMRRTWDVTVVPAPEADDAHVPEDMQTNLVIDPDCRDGKHTSCIGGRCECECHSYRGAARAIACRVCGAGADEDCVNTVSGKPMPVAVHGGRVADFAEQTRPAADDLEPLPQRKPAGPPAHPWQAAMDAQLSPEALAGGVPLATLAPETEDLPGPETGEWGAQSSVITSRAGEPLATLASEQEDEVKR